MGVPGGSSLINLSNEVFDYIYHGSGKGWVRFCIRVGLCFTFMDWMTHGRLRMTRYPLFLDFLAVSP